MLRITDSRGGYLAYADLLQGQSAYMHVPKRGKKGLSRHALKIKVGASIHILTYLVANTGSHITAHLPPVQ